MNGKILAGLGSLLLIATPATAPAQAAAPQPPLTPTPSPLIQNLTPFQLVNLAYEGGLQAQGIPSYGQLQNAYGQNQITANGLVAAAVEGQLVPANTINDGNYINAVRLQLRSLAPDSRDYRWP